MSTQIPQCKSCGGLFKRLVAPFVCQRCEVEDSAQGSLASMDSVHRDAKIAAAETTRRLQEQRNNVRTERMDSIKKRKVSFNRL